MHIFCILRKFKKTVSKKRHLISTYIIVETRCFCILNNLILLNLSIYVVRCLAKKNRKKNLETSEKIAKYAMLGAWAVPATELIKAIKEIIKILLK